MFVILTYDVNRKTAKTIKHTCDKYLHHIQNSVFEGDITQSELKELKQKLEKIINKELDSICIYSFDSIKYARREQIGQSVVYGNII